MAPASKRSLQPLAILGLTVVWVGLWGSLTAVTVLGGVVLASSLSSAAKSST